jgi:hypothetical protein
MMNRKDGQEKLERCQHRSAALFCVIQCWIKSLDGIVLERSAIERLFDLERIKEERVKWLVEDFKDFFLFSLPKYEPYVSPEGYTRTYQPTSSSLTVSRIPLENDPKIESLELWKRPTWKRLDEIHKDFIPFFVDSDNYDQRFLASYLSLLAQGQISPQSIPPLI